eukprot:1155324-Pelagomonas_calceolata.AAC.4
MPSRTAMNRKIAGCPLSKCSHINLVQLFSHAFCDLEPYVAQGPIDKVYKAALALGTANQLTNILRDVGEDIRERDRIYLPLDELKQFGISEEETLTESSLRVATTSMGCCLFRLAKVVLPLQAAQSFGSGQYSSEQDCLVKAGIHKPSQGKVDERWRAFMKFQIKRAREYFQEAEDGVDYLDVKARWPVW